MALVPRTLLFDNGSLRAASTLNLRCIAAGLSTRLGAPVEAVSLLHSSGIDPAELGGEPARLLEPSVLASLENEPERPIVVLPFFFGPSAALTDYVPARLAAAQARYPGARLIQADPLCPQPDAPEPRLVEALARVARRTLATAGLAFAPVVLVDHGSPQRAVAEVRNHLARALGDVLAKEGIPVFPASMERRPDPAYDFNEPLLAGRLATPPCDEGDVVVLLQFLSPGRHAGPEGDIAQICAESREARPGLRTWMSDTLGHEPEVAEVLAQRWHAALRAAAEAGK